MMINVKKILGAVGILLIASMALVMGAGAADTETTADTFDLIINSSSEQDLNFGIVLNISNEKILEGIGTSSDFCNGDGIYPITITVYDENNNDITDDSKFGFGLTGVTAITKPNEDNKYATLTLSPAGIKSPKFPANMSKIAVTIVDVDTENNENSNTLIDSAIFSVGKIPSGYVAEDNIGYDQVDIIEASPAVEETESGITLDASSGSSESTSGSADVTLVSNNVSYTFTIPQKIELNESELVVADLMVQADKLDDKTIVISVVGVDENETPVINVDESDGSALFMLSGNDDKTTGQTATYKIGIIDDNKNFLGIGYDSIIAGTGDLLTFNMVNQLNGDTSYSKEIGFSTIDIPAVGSYAGTVTFNASVSTPVQEVEAQKE